MQRKKGNVSNLQKGKRVKPVSVKRPYVKLTAKLLQKQKSQATVADNLGFLFSLFKEVLHLVFDLDPVVGIYPYPVDQEVCQRGSQAGCLVQLF